MSARLKRRGIRGVAAVVGVAGVAALAWGTLVERHRYMLREVSVPVLPRGSSPIRVLHLSDLHMAPWQRGKQEWIRYLAALQPDLIVNTGDNLGHERGIEGIRRAFEPFAGIPGVFVNGSNDYFGPILKNPFGYFSGPSKSTGRAKRLDTDTLLEYFDELGWIDLNNTARALDIRGVHLEVFGVDDPHNTLDRLDLIAGSIDELRAEDAIAGDWDTEEQERPTVTLALAHAPYQRVLDSFVNHGAQVIFAGHTHGGQVCLPGVGALVANCDLPRKQASGLSLWHHGLRTAYLNVSSGLGTSIYAPVRFACPPEVSLVTLTALP